MDAVLLTQSTTTVPEPALLGLATGIVAFAAVLALLLSRATAPRRPTPGPTRMEPAGSESPALVALLIDQFDLPAEAAEATLVDLAARRWLNIEQYGEDRILIRLRHREPDDDRLRPHEQTVLDHVRAKAVDSVAPAGALTTGDGHGANRWWHGFRCGVEAEARERGYARPRWTRASLGALWVAVATALVTVWAAFEFGNEVPAGEAEVSPLGGLALVGAIGLSWYAGRVTRAGALRDTDEGLAAAGAWLGTRRWFEEQGDFATTPAAAVAIWDRNLAYATAFGLAATVDRELPLGQECDRRAWSNAGGTWRQVRVRYPRLPPGWGDHPFKALLSGLVQATVGGALSYVALVTWTGQAEAIDELELEPDVLIWIQRIALLVMLVVGPLVLVAAAKAVLGLVDLFPRRDVEGLVLRARARRQGDWMPGPVQTVWYSGNRSRHHTGRRNRTVSYWVAVDDGTVEAVRALRVRSSIHREAPQGARIRLRRSPVLGYVSRLEVLASPPHADQAPTADRVEQLAGGAAGMASAWLTRLADAAATHGASVPPVPAAAPTVTPDAGSVEPPAPRRPDVGSVEPPAPRRPDVGSVEPPAPPTPTPEQPTSPPPAQPPPAVAPPAVSPPGR